MKKIVLILVLALTSAPVVLADGNAFTPLNVNDTTTYSNKTIAAPTADIKSQTEAIGNGNIQNAISQLENAQVDIRNDLLNCKTKYSDVDAQYKLVKAERTALKKQISSIEKRIKELDKAKEKIKKNML